MADQEASGDEQFAAPADDAALASSASFSVAKYHKQLHDINRFTSGNERMDRWLHRSMSQYEKRDLARTFVLVRSEESVSKPQPIYGYYTLSNHSVRFADLPDAQQKGLPRNNVPVVLIGQLAVHTDCQRQGLGEHLLLDALAKIQIISASIAIRAVEVDAIDQPARDFYLKYGFLSLQDDPMHLFLPMTTIRQLDLVREQSK